MRKGLLVCAWITVLVVAALVSSGQVARCSNMSDTFKNLTLTAPNTEYSYVLPQGCVGYEFQCRTAYDLKWGKTGATGTTYFTLKSGSTYSTFSLPYDYSGEIVAVQSAETGVVVEFHCLIKR